VAAGGREPFQGLRAAGDGYLHGVSDSRFLLHHTLGPRCRATWEFDSIEDAVEAAEPIFHVGHSRQEIEDTRTGARWLRLNPVWAPSAAEPNV